MNLARLFHDDDSPRGAFHPLVAAWVEQLTTAEPMTFAAGARLSNRARQVGAALGLADCAGLEAAARLLPVGRLALPLPLLAKLHEHAPLSASETDLLARVPELGAQLLENIPPLAGVAEMVRYQAKGFDGSGSPIDGVMGTDLPLGARILRPLIDLDTQEAAGVSPRAAVLQLARDARRYDGAVLRVITERAPDWACRPPQPIEVAMIADLQPGMQLDDDVVIVSGQRLVASGTCLSRELIARLRNSADRGQLVEPFVVVRPLRLATA